MSRLDRTMGDQGAEVEAPEYVSPVASWSSTVDVDPSKMVFPRLTLAQGLSKAVTAEGSTAKMGDWIVNGYPEVKEVIFVPIQYGISRRLPTYSPEGKAMVAEGQYLTDCYSPTGAEHGIGEPGIQCAACPLKEWQARPDSHPYKGNWQPCIQSYDFVGWSVTHETPVTLSLSKTSASAGKMLEMLGFTRKLGNFMVRLSTERKTTNGNTYAVAKVTILPPDSDVLANAKALLALPG
jgi:hypothetical protein